jgi:hypothetical protein
MQDSNYKRAQTLTVKSSKDISAAGVNKIQGQNVPGTNMRFVPDVFCHLIGKPL